MEGQGHGPPGPAGRGPEQWTPQPYSTLPTDPGSGPPTGESTGASDGGQPPRHRARGRAVSRGVQVHR